MGETLYIYLQRDTHDPDKWTWPTKETRTFEAGQTGSGFNHESDPARLIHAVAESIR